MHNIDYSSKNFVRLAKKYEQNATNVSFCENVKEGPPGRHKNNVTILRVPFRKALMNRNEEKQREANRLGPSLRTT